MDQLWSVQISVLLCEGPKPANSMISGLLTPGEPLFIAFYYTKLLQIIYENMDTFSKIPFLKIVKFQKSSMFDLLEQIWKRWAPKDDEDPSNNISQILNMGPISS